MLEDLDVVLDVGGVYDPSLDRYDHHQKGFGEVFGHGFSTKLSSAGLVFRVFLDFERQINACSVEFNRSLFTTQLWWFNFLDYQSVFCFLSLAIWKGDYS